MVTLKTLEFFISKVFKILQTYTLFFTYLNNIKHILLIFLSYYSPLMAINFLKYYLKIYYNHHLLILPYLVSHMLNHKIYYLL